MTTDFSGSPAAARRFSVSLQRGTFSPRLVARAGDVWRAMQDLVVQQSNDVGWTPDRYVAANTMFVVRTMTVQHLRELHIDDVLTGTTWPSRARRQMLFTRQVRLFAGETLTAAATQEWAYLSRRLEPIRAGKDLFDAFTVFEGHPDVELPAFVKDDAAPAERFDFVTWHGWMDPHAHVNHAAYVDFCDEGVARWAAGRGVDPQGVVPIAETVHFRAALGAGVTVTVETTRIGHAHGDAVFAHRILQGDTVCALATTVRRFPGAP